MSGFTSKLHKAHGMMHGFKNYSKQIICLDTDAAGVDTRMAAYILSLKQNLIQQNLNRLGIIIYHTHNTYRAWSDH